MIHIAGVAKADVLVALYESSRLKGINRLNTMGHTSLSREEAEFMLESGQTRFEKIYGRPIRVDLDSDWLDEREYDKQNGFGSAWRAIEQLRRR